MLDRTTRIAVAGAGSIGCHAGGSLALAGRTVTLLARQRLAETVRDKGLAIADLDGAERRLAPAAISAVEDPAAAFAGAGLVLVTVKSRDTAEMAELIARHAPPDAVVVSLQNGTANAAQLRERLAATQRAVAGMVSFNVIQSEAPDGAPLFRRTTSGEILVEADVPGLVELLNVAGLPVASAPDMTAVLWGKLLLNLNNAINALSGLPLVEQLSDRRWRLVMAAQIGEALAAMRAAGIRPARIGALRPALLPHVLRLPDFVFRILARRMISIDPEVRPSTAVDLERGRPTETDEFQGAIVRLAEEHGAKAPLSRLVLERIRAAEAAGKGSPRLSPDDFALSR
jgi:2-dehydropantoate 2-reductase